MRRSEDLKKHADLHTLSIMPKLSSPRIDRLLEDVLGCRWTISVLRAVAAGTCRPGAIERRVYGISTKVLSDRLKRFTRAGIFERKLFAEIPPRVEYYLTPFGRKFLKILRDIEKLQLEFDDSPKGGHLSKGSMGNQKSKGPHEHLPGKQSG